MNDITHKPLTYQGNLARLPRALAPLIEKPQLTIWRWTPKPGGGFQKPPFQALRPERHASVTDPNTWASYGTALAAVQAGRGDGLTYVLTELDGLAAIDLDHCRDAITGSVEAWAQLMLEQALHTYCEITVSGSGLRIWGTASGDVLHRKFDLDAGDKAAIELFRCTNKALTVSGLDLLQGGSLGNIDRLMDWCVFYGEKHKLASGTPASSIRLNGDGSGYSVNDIEQIVRDGAPPGGNRSNLFHTIVGHYTGCSWSIKQTFEQVPERNLRTVYRRGSAQPGDIPQLSEVEQSAVAIA